MSSHKRMSGQGALSPDPGSEGEYTITPQELEAGCSAYEEYEKRDSVYRVARFCVELWWGQTAKMVDALAALLYGWNASFYRFGPFDPERLGECLSREWSEILHFRKRDILSLSGQDGERIKKLFKAFWEALAIARGKSKGRRAAVSAAKTLHLLAPDFFPPWDEKIALHYRCNYNLNLRPAPDAYLKFCEIIRGIAAPLAPVVSLSDKSLLKRIDEFNYMSYTQGWKL